MKTILITGAAGFIGTHLTNLLSKKHFVITQDSLINRASIVRKNFHSNLQEISIHDEFISKAESKPNVVIHLAAETGIAGSLKNPDLYFHQNVQGTFNVLEECRKNGVKYLIYASSSSVYEPNEIMSENAPHEKQLSFYGTSKRMTEIMIENYCRQFGITAIGLRFFTVYGSWTRPDMAAYKFMKAINNDEKITLYNDGNVKRDFTHVSDIVKSIEILISKIPELPLGEHNIYNIGSGKPISVLEYSELIAKHLNKELKFEYKGLPSNELESTHSDTSELEKFIGYKPICDIEQGIKEMTDWYKKQNYE